MADGRCSPPFLVPHSLPHPPLRTPTHHTARSRLTLSKRSRFAFACGFETNKTRDSTRHHSTDHSTDSFLKVRSRSLRFPRPLLRFSDHATQIQTLDHSPTAVPPLLLRPSVSRGSATVSFPHSRRLPPSQSGNNGKIYDTVFTRFKLFCP